MSDQTFDRTEYVEKVRKLLAKAEGAATPEEAEAFFGKAQSLIAKWEIAEAELAEARAAGDVNWKIIQRSYPLSSYSPNQDSFAMQCVARAMGLRAFQTPYIRGCQKSTTEVFGTEEDLDRFEMMWASVSLQMTRFMKEQESGAWNRNQLRTFRLGFKAGFGERIGERIQASRDRQTGKDCSKALVLIGKSEAIELALPEGIRSRTIKANGAALDAGRTAADKADIDSAERVEAAKAHAVIGA